MRITKRVNKKGFTLVEVIAVVVILGVMLTAAIVGYSKYIEKSKKNYYEKQKDLVTQAGRDYFNDNRGRLPINISEENCVLLSTLINNKYIDDVLGYDKKACDKGKSKVCAQKISLTKYKYNTTLVCGDDIQEEIGNAPNINFSLFNATNKKVEDSNFIQDDNYEGKQNNLYNIDIDIVSDTPIGSYDYYVHQIKNGKDTVIRSKKNISVPDSTKEYNISVPLNTSGKYYIEVKVFNQKSSNISKSGKVTLNITKSTCSSITFEQNGSQWINSDITNIINLGDFKYNYYTLQLIDSKTNKVVENIKENDNFKLKSKVLENKIELSDSKSSQFYYKLTTYNENSNDTCNIKSNIYKIDKIKPTCIATSNIKTWTNQDVTIHVVCSDSDSGCVKNSDDIIIKEQYNDYMSVDVSDKAGNTNICKTSDKILIDKTKPSASITSTNDVASQQIATLSMSDDQVLDKYYFGKIDPDGNDKSSIVYTTISGDVKEFNTQVNITENGKYYLSVLDKAGNITNINKTYYKTTLSPGRGEVNPSVIITMGGNSFNIPTPSDNNGYKFDNWCNDSALNNIVSSPYKPVDNVTLYGKWKANGYTIEYVMNGGSNPSKHPTKGTYNQNIEITNPPKKTINITIDQYFYLFNNDGSIYRKKVAKTTNDILSKSLSVDQGFTGWNSTTIDSNAQSGNSTNSLNSWDGTLTKNTYFKDLKDTGSVTMIANWDDTSSVKLPEIKKFGYKCTYNTKSNGKGDSFEPGTDFRPSSTATDMTLYPVCNANVFTVTYAPNRENYLLNYTFNNSIKVTGTSDGCSGNACVCKDDSNISSEKITDYLKYNKYNGNSNLLYHINEWPVYSPCVVSGFDLEHQEYKYYAHLDKDSDSSHGNVVAFPVGDSKNEPNPLDFSFQLSDVLRANDIYVLSFDIKKNSSDDIVLKTGIRSGDDKTVLYSVPVDKNINKPTSFDVSSTSSWTTKTIVFRITSEGFQYIDRFSNGYGSSGDYQADYINSGRPELFFSYDVSDKNKRGTIYIDNVKFYKASTTEMDYDSSFNDNPPPNITKNGHLFAGWYKDMSSSLNLNDNNKIVANNNTVNKDNLTCESYLDNDSNEYNVCYLYAGWFEKEYKIDLNNLPSGASQSTSNVVKFSEVPYMIDSSKKPVYTNNGKKFAGWTEFNKKSLTTNSDPFLLKLDSTDGIGQDKCDGIYSYGNNMTENSSSFESNYNHCGYQTNNDNKPTLRFKVENDGTTAPYVNKRITLNNDRFPNLSNPGFGGYCQSLTGNLDPEKEYVHIVIVSMGDGLYLHYDPNNKTDANWLTNNEGKASPKMYMYKFKPTSDANNVCVYFSQKYDEEISGFERQHMSSYLYFSGVFDVNDVQDSFGQLCNSQNVCSDDSCCDIEWNASWKEKPLRVYYNVDGAKPLSGSEYNVSSDLITKNNSVYYDVFESGSTVKITKHPTNTFKVGISGYDAKTNEEWGSSVKLNTNYSWSTIKQKATELSDYYKLVLTANWQARSSICTITYKPEGGSISNTKQTYTCSSSSTGKITLLTPSRVGYTFTGWTYNGNTYAGGSAWNQSNTGNYTLTATWKINSYTITYNANGGSGAPGATTYQYAISGNTKLSSTKPTRSGYTFLGWSQKSNATSPSYQAGQSWSRSNASNYTLYAVWRKNTNYCWKSNWTCTYYYCTVGSSYSSFAGSIGGCATGYTFHPSAGNTNSGMCQCDTATCGAWKDNGSYVAC